jgi:hypothetical protein
VDAQADRLTCRIEPYLDAVGPDYTTEGRVQEDLANLLWDILAYLRKQEKEETDG